jgi:hypothetical protein
MVMFTQIALKLNSHHFLCAAMQSSLKSSQPCSATDSSTIAMAHKCKTFTYQSSYECRPSMETRRISSRTNDTENLSPTLPTPKDGPICDQNTLQASPSMQRVRLERMLLQEPGIPTLDRTTNVIQTFGIETAWNRISDIAASHLAKHRGLDGDFRIHDFYRPQDYTTLTDLMMVVADTEVQLGLLCSSDIGRTLLQQLFSIKDARGQRISTISADRIKEMPQADYTAPDPPCLVHVSSNRLYISWKTNGWWEAYKLSSLDTVMRETLDALPCTIMRPQPSSAWIKKRRPTVRYPASSWDPALLSPIQSNLTLAERNCDEPPPHPASMIPRSSRPLASRTNCWIPLASPTLTKQMHEEAWVENRGSLIPCVYHATEPLPPMTASDSRIKKSISRRLWEKLICM